MNYTLLDEAYKIHHINSTTYGGNNCIYCKNPTSTPLIPKVHLDNVIDVEKTSEL